MDSSAKFLHGYILRLQCVYSAQLNVLDFGGQNLNIVPTLHGDSASNLARSQRADPSFRLASRGVVRANRRNGKRVKMRALRQMSSAGEVARGTGRHRQLLIGLVSVRNFMQAMKNAQLSFGDPTRDTQKWSSHGMLPTPAGGRHPRHEHDHRKTQHDQQ